MSTNPNADYYKPSQGSLTGFSSITPSGGSPNIVKTGWSIEDLRAFLLNESDINFPTADFVRRLDELINDHINDFNNPHQVKLDQVIGSFVRDVLGSVVPGTPPNIPPFFAYDAACGLPFGDIFPADHTTTNVYRMTDGGSFVVPSTESENVGTDLVNNKSGLPLFQNITNYVPTNWASQPLTLLNTTIEQVSHPVVSYPFNFYTLYETGNTGSFGAIIPFNGNSVNVCTFTVFLFPLITGGSVIISETGNHDNTMIVDLDEGTFICSSNLVLGEVFTYPSGAMRVSFTFTPLNNGPNSSVRLLHVEDDVTDLTRTGVIDRPLFMLANPVVTNSARNQPVLINNTIVGSTSPMVIELEKVPAPPFISHLMITVTTNIYPTLPNGLQPDRLVLRFGTLTIERDQTAFYVMQNNVTLFTVPILDGLNTLSLSYSPTLVIFKDFTSLRQEQVGVFPTLATNNVVVGPFAGYLQSLAFYATSDTSRCVEFLTNG